MRAPLAFLLATIAGVVFDLPAGLVCSAAVGLASLAVVSTRAWRLPLAVGAVACLCAAHAALARDVALSSPLSVALGPLLDDRQAPPVWISGVLHADAAVDADGARLAIDVDSVRLDGVAGPWRAVGGRAQVGVGGSLTGAAVGQWVRGRRIVAPVLVRRPQIWRNPGAPSERWQRLHRGTDISGSVKSAALVAVLPGRWWSEWGARVRAHVRRTLNRTVGRTSVESAGIVTAILIGDRTGLNDATIRRLQMAGTYHVIAISGGNIAIVVMVCLAGLRLFVRSPRWIAALTLAVVLVYGGLVGDQASVSRAVTAAAVVLGLQMAGWCAPTLQIFVVAALGVALTDPLAVIDVGAWLSFGATLGILLLSGPISRRLSSRPHSLAAMAAGMLAATVAAELALMPVSAAVFSRVSVAGLLLNFIAIPAMTVAQLAGTAVVLIAPLSSWLAQGAALLAHVGAFALVRSANVLDVWPWLSWQTPPVWWGWTAAYYAGVAVALFAAARGPLQRAAVGIAAVSLTVILVAPNWPSAGPAAGFLRVAMLDVGQGQSIAVQFPSGQSLLVDAGGSASSFDIGARVVEPALWALGIQRLNWLAVTHGEVDHAGGAASVLRDMRPDEVWEGVPVPRDSLMQALRADVHAQGAVWRRLVSGHTFEVGSVLVEVINPPAPDWERRDSRNDDSLVVRVQFGQVSFLLTGDIERAAEENLPLDRAPRLRLVTAPHHGSRTSSSSALLRHWLPHAAFVSAGRGNSFGHPAPDVLARYRQLGVEVFRTDLDGAIVIDTDGRTVFVRTSGGRSWRLSYVDDGPGID